MAAVGDTGTKDINEPPFGWSDRKEKLQPYRNGDGRVIYRNPNDTFDYKKWRDEQ